MPNSYKHPFIWVILFKRADTLIFVKLVPCITHKRLEFIILWETSYLSCSKADKLTPKYRSKPTLSCQQYSTQASCLWQHAEYHQNFKTFSHTKNTSLWSMS